MNSTEWTPRNKYEVAPGLFVGSEIGDIDREVKALMRKHIQDNDHEALCKIKSLHARRIEMLKLRRLRKK